MGPDFHLEKLALCFLCAGTLEGAVRDVLVPLLRAYQWQCSLHQALFDAIAAVPSEDPQLFRQLLPAKLTRMGFPDVEWEEFFAPPSVAKEEAIALIRQMLAGT
jgi:hypothetical protein